MQVYVQAFEGQNGLPSFTIEFTDIMNMTGDGVAIHSIGHEAARKQKGWDEERINAARWVVFRNDVARPI